MVHRKKNNLVAVKNKWKKPQEEPHRRGPSPRIDRHAVLVTCTEQANKTT